MQGQPQMLKAVNQSAILKLIYENGPVTKPELAQKSGLSLPTVNKSVDTLCELNLVKEVAVQTELALGRKAKYFSIDERSVCVAVVMYHEKKWLGVVTDFFGAELARCSAALEGESFEESMQSLYNVLDTLVAKAPHIQMIGVGIPGAVMPEGKVLSIPLIASWEEKNIQSVLADRYGKSVLVENDIKLKTLGYYEENLPHLQNLVYFYIGTGVGGGVVINGQLYKGNFSFAGELGYLADSSAQGENHKVGSLEGHLRELEKEITTGEKPEAARAAYYEQIARGMVNAVAMLGPDAIVFDGALISDATLNAAILPTMRRLLPSYVMPRAFLAQGKEYGTLGLIHLCLNRVKDYLWHINT